MTAKLKKTKHKKTGSRSGRIARLHASVPDELLRLAEEDAGAESRWNRPRKQRISLRLDCATWFNPGYQTRINRILRTVMVESKKRMGGK